MYSLHYLITHWINHLWGKKKAIHSAPQRGAYGHKACTGTRWSIRWAVGRTRSVLLPGHPVHTAPSARARPLTRWQLQQGVPGTEPPGRHTSASPPLPLAVSPRPELPAFTSQPAGHSGLHEPEHRTRRSRWSLLAFWDSPTYPLWGHLFPQTSVTMVKLLPITKLDSNDWKWVWKAQAFVRITAAAAWLLWIHYRSLRPNPRPTA